MINLLLAALPLAVSANAVPLAEAYASASAKMAAQAQPCAAVSQIKLERPALAQGDVFYGFLSETFSTGGHKAWKIVKDAKVFGDKPGSMDASADPAEFQSLVKAVNTPAFFSLNAQYSGATLGAPTSLTVTCQDGRSKSVVVDGTAAPAAFQSAVDALLKLAGSLFWVS